MSHLPGTLAHLFTEFVLRSALSVYPWGVTQESGSKRSGLLFPYLHTILLNSIYQVQPSFHAK